MDNNIEIDQIYYLDELSSILQSATTNFTSFNYKKCAEKFSKSFWTAEYSKMVALQGKARSAYKKFPSPETRATFNLQAAKTKTFLRSNHGCIFVLL